MATSPSISASAHWSTPKQTRYTDLHLESILSSGTNEQRAALLLQLDADCDTLLNIVREMRAHRNACAPVSVLPPEVLTKIFAFLARSWRTSWRIDGSDHTDEGESEEEKKPGWLVVAIVCRRWHSICYAAPELWPRNDTLHEAGIASLSAEAILIDQYDEPHWHKTNISPPYFLPVLRKIHLGQLRELNMTEVLRILSLTPLLEDLAISVCTWNDTIPTSHPLTLSRLRSLSLLRRGYPCENWSNPNVTQLQRFLDNIRFPRNIFLNIEPEFGGEADDTSIAVLHSLMLRCIQNVELPESPLCIGLDLSELISGIYFMPTPVFTATIASRSPRHLFGHSAQLRFWRTGIDMLYLPLDHVFRHPSIVALTEDISMLSMSMSTVRQHHQWDSPITVLYRLFRRVEILHTYLLPSVIVGTTSKFLSSLFDITSDDLNFPRMRELWLGGPVAPNDAHYINRGEVLGQFADALGPRMAHPANVLTTLRIAIPRPSAESLEGAPALALESLIPNVFWSDSAWVAGST